MRITARNIGQLPYRKLGKLDGNAIPSLPCIITRSRRHFRVPALRHFRSLSHALEHSPVLHFKLHFDASSGESDSYGDDGFSRIATRFNVLISPEPGYPITLAKSILVLDFFVCLSSCHWWIKEEEEDLRSEKEEKRWKKTAWNVATLRQDADLILRGWCRSVVPALPYQLD